LGDVAAAIVLPFVILVGAFGRSHRRGDRRNPSLRLRGDYLAIATLGFAEIIRIVIVNTNKVGGRNGISRLCRFS
jgi:branched-chain amino acid transport system permease protein